MVAQLPRCGATRVDGTPCEARARTGRPFCWAHDPDLADKRDEARREGGHNITGAVAKRSTSARIERAASLVEQAMTQVYKGKLTPAQGQAVASDARALVRLLEVGELNQRLLRLENAAKTPQGQAE